MLHKVRKLFTDYKKEEEWLNEMVQKGYALVKYNFINYHFESCEPGEYIYRLQLLDQVPSHQESIDYFKFVKELEIEHVCSYYRWAYFRKRADQGPFQVHSDVESVIKHYKSIMTLQGVIALSNLSISFSNINLGAYNNVSQYFGLINLFFAVLLGSLCIGNYKKVKRLKSEQTLHE